MSGSEYSLLSYGQFEKMTFFPPDPLLGVGVGDVTSQISHDMLCWGFQHNIKKLNKMRCWLHPAKFSARKKASLVSNTMHLTVYPDSIHVSDIFKRKNEISNRPPPYLAMITNATSFELSCACVGSYCTRDNWQLLVTNAEPIVFLSLGRLYTFLRNLWSLCTLARSDSSF